MGVARPSAMRSAGRLSRCLMVLGVVSLLAPASALASGRPGAGAAQAKKQGKTKTSADAKKSKEKMALARSKSGGKGKGSTKAAGFLPRPASGKGTTKKAGGEAGRGMLATAMAGDAPVKRAKTTKATKKTAAKKTTKKTRRPVPRRRVARTQRPRSRSSAGLAASELAAAQAEDAAMAQAGGEMGAPDFDGPVRPQSRFRRFLSGTGRVLKAAGKYAGYGLVVAAPMAVMAVGGLPIAFAIAAPAIFLGIPMAIGLIEQRAKQSQGIDDPQGELLQRYMSRQMLENQNLNGPGPGNGVAGVGGLNSLNNMIDPGGMR